MNLTASLSRGSLLRLFLVNLFFGILASAAAWYGSQTFFSPVAFADLMELAINNPETQPWARSNAPVFELVQSWFYPGLAVFVLFLTLIQWLVLRGGFKRAVRKSGVSDSPGKNRKEPAGKDEKQKEAKKDVAFSHQELNEHYERYYLQLISVLQRNGRLLDFFHEDLSSYEDAQIGAAVRSIHENCSRSMEKAIAPASVIDRPEGQQITVPADFDSSAIKLTGNVTGEPPFTGVIRHRGWRAGRVELPVLSASGDSRVIAPAEVEIQ